MIRHFKKFLSVLILFCFSSTLAVFAQTPTLIVDAPPLDRNTNFISNGSFEVPHLEDGYTFDDIIPGVDGDGYYFLSTNPDNVNIPKALPDGWNFTGGGDLSYARWGNNFGDFPPGVIEAGQVWSSPHIDGERTVYLGNFTPAEISEEPTFLSTGEVVFPAPPVITLRPGYGPDPVQIYQEVDGLVPGKLYRFSFWTSGEWSSEEWFNVQPLDVSDGIVGIQIEGYDLLYLTIPAGFGIEVPQAPHVFGTDESHVYTVEFEAVDTVMNIGFVNWGHFGDAPGTIGWNRGRGTEAVVDDIIVNLVDDEFVLNPIYPALDDNINFIAAENASSNNNVAFIWGFRPGEYVLGGNICDGVRFGIDKPRLLNIERANDFGVATYIFYIPLFNDFEFTVETQALDINTCRVSNQINQVIRKEEGG